MSVTLSLLAAHAVADFPLQTDRMAQEKFDNPLVRLGHVAVHAVFTFLFLLPLAQLTSAVYATLYISGFHFLVDSRRWAEPKEGFEAYPIAVDQSLHLTVLWAASSIFL